MSKLFVLLFALILATSSIGLVKPAYSVTQPSVPEFTVDFDGDTIVLTIKNQPLDELDLGSDVFRYNVRVKVHNSTSWTHVYYASQGNYPSQSGSEYTILQYSMSFPVGYGVERVRDYYKEYADLDFQVEAMIGHYGRTVVGGAFGAGDDFIGEKSGWSKTHTVINHNLNPDLLKFYISSPENYETYATDNAFLNLTIAGETAWVGYSIDGQSNMTLTENAVKLVGLSSGSHNITVYATEIEGALTKTETKHFVIARTFDIEQIIEEDFDPNSKTGLNQKAKTDPVAVIALAAVATVGVAGAIYFATFKKHRRVFQSKLPEVSG